MKNKIENFYIKQNHTVGKGESFLVYFMCDSLLNSFIYSLQLFLIPTLVLALMGFGEWINYSFFVFIGYIHILGYQIQRPLYN